MLSHAAIQQALQNLNLLIAHADTDMSMFTLQRDGTLTRNRFLPTHPHALNAWLQRLVDYLRAPGTNYHDLSTLNLYNTLQHFLHLAHLEVELDMRGTHLARQKLTLHRHAHESSQNTLREHMDDLPHIEKDDDGLYTSPDDHMAHRHGEEAQRIFFATQFERFKGFLNWLLGKLGLHVFENARYEEHDYIDSDIYAHHPAVTPADQAPSHYWVGHASNFLVIPTAEAPLHVLTDPVEGALAPLIYPRMTREGRLIEGEGFMRLPKVDVVIISHNHRDHVCEATLKRLVRQQPKMIVPEGDGALFRRLGFENIVELKWWEQASITDAHQEEVLRVTATPARHWSGRGLHDAHRSAFNGYVLQSERLQGDVYFAGDTALMEDATIAPVFETFRITTSLQPGGPDEQRGDMESTHQSSADGILMHFKILEAEYRKMCGNDNDNDEEDDAANLPTLQAFLDRITPVKTLYNHTATFKLGNLRLRDTFFSFQRMCAAFKEDDNWRKANLPSHEQAVFRRITALVQNMEFAQNERLDAAWIEEHMRHAIVIPKIGERQALTSEAHDAPAFAYRSLITNHRALTACDTLVQRYLENSRQPNLSDLLSALFNMYTAPWHAALTRGHRENLHTIINAITNCEPGALFDTLLEQERNLDGRSPHGHLQSLFHYAKWLVQFVQAHPNDAAQKLREFFDCRAIQVRVDEEMQRLGDKDPAKHQAFAMLADGLASLPPEKERYRQTIADWREAQVDTQKTVGMLLGEHRSTFFDAGLTRSAQAVESISALASLR